MNLLKFLSTDFFKVATFEDLTKINNQLAGYGLPPYWLGGASFNTCYRLSNKPRFVFSFSGLRLTQVYLIGLANSTEPAYEAMARFMYLTEPLPEQITTREITLYL